MVPGVGVQRHAVDEPVDVPQVVAAQLRDRDREVQDAYAGRPWTTRLPARRLAGLRPVHHAAAAEGPIEDAVLPGRRPLGAEAAELTVVVGDGGWLGG